MSMSYHQEPLPKGLPRLPIPGRMTTTGPQSHWPLLGTTYKYVFQFWSITFEMNYLYYFKHAASPASAVAISQKLLIWADALNTDVKRDEHNPDHVLNLQ
jgi:hypothetical protein